MQLAETNLIISREAITPIKMIFSVSVFFSTFSKNKCQDEKNIKSLVKPDLFCSLSSAERDEKVCSGSRFGVMSLFLIYHCEGSHDGALVLHHNRI